MKSTLLLISLISSLLNGCIGFMPVPPNSNTPSMGARITGDQVKFVVPGCTTRDEVVARLGGRFRESPHTPVLAYSWEQPAWGSCWWVFFITPEAIVTGGNYDEGCVWRAYYVKFDDNGRVVKTKFARLDDGRSLDEQMENWAGYPPKQFLKDGAGVFNPDNGAPLPFDWMKDNLHLQPVR